MIDQTFPIRFFATNRDRENLGRTVDGNQLISRDQRIQLQKGGYHWVDMRKYMSHYLATTAPSDIPPQAVITNSEETVFNLFLCKPAIKRIIIGIHGFNVPFHGALTSFSVLSDTLSLSLQKHGSRLVTDPDHIDNSMLEDANQDLTAFIGFSWTSKGNVLAYLSDRAEAVQTAPVLANLISRIRYLNPQAKIDIIAHSMGNYLTCNMLKGLIDQTFKPIYTNPTIEKQLERRDKGGDKAFFIDRYLMLAPDVERREVTQCDDLDMGNSSYIGPFFAGLWHLVEATHVFYSRYDTALKASVSEKDIVDESIQKGIELFTGTDLQKRWESSLGLNPLPALAPDNMQSHNATVLTNRAIDHGDYFDALAIHDAIAKVIIEN